MKKVLLKDVKLQLKKVKNSWGEYKVKDFDDRDGDYLTDDWQDAVFTFRHIAKDKGLIVDETKPNFLTAYTYTEKEIDESTIVDLDKLREEEEPTDKTTLNGLLKGIATKEQIQYLQSMYNLYRYTKEKEQEGKKTTTFESAYFFAQLSGAIDIITLVIENTDKRIDLQLEILKTLSFERVFSK